TLMLMSCAKETDDLPPLPPPPGGDAGVGRAVAGMAISLPNWAAQARNVALAPAKPYYGDGVVVSVSDFDYIYKNGYFFNSKLRSWEKFDLQGELVQDWLKGQGVASVAVTADKFETGDNYLVVYACKKVGKDWDCNNKKWMLVTFNVMGAAGGITPEMENVDKFVVKSISPFELMSTFAEKDNFLDINVIRYDGKYKGPAPDGLIVLVHVFEFNSRADVDSTINNPELFRDIVVKGWKTHIGHNLAVFLDENDHRIAVWTSGKVIVYVESFQKEAANKEVIEGYLAKYPSDLVKP
ncbi:hypothetical protein KY319_01180, partial [Candidatus Woesearchaeota archaeon]|nr:hypothetical protein [Candidatus Woesearchaeota archaeon]